MLTTTLNDIRKHSPCQDGWEKLLKHLGKTKADDEPVSFETILESNGIDDALWCLQALPEELDGKVRHLACDFAETALQYVPQGEDRPRKAIDVARRYADGKATDKELDAAWAAAWAAARAAAWAAAWAAARAAARDAARDAAWDAAWDAARAAAWDAAWDAARAAARAAAWDAHRQIFENWLKQF
jgi:hypothetical protein